MYQFIAFNPPSKYSILMEYYKSHFYQVHAEAIIINQYRFLFVSLKNMHSNNEPNWLDIEQQLYPQIYIRKTLHLDSSTSGGMPIQFQVQVLYNSLHREINVTESIAELIFNFYSEQGKYEIFIYDTEEERFRSVGNFPFKQPILLKGVFVENELLVVKIQTRPDPQKQDKVKAKTDKTLKFVLQKVAQWRKIHIDSQKKITLEQAANSIGIARNTLDDYYFQIKAAQKYGYNFQEQLDQPFQSLRKFVKQQEEKAQKQKSPNPLPNILSKYQPK